MRLQIWHGAALAAVIAAVTTVVVLHVVGPRTVEIVAHFDRPVPGPTVGRAVALIEHRVEQRRVKIRTRGQDIIIETPVETALEVMGELAPKPFALDVRLLDDGARWMRDLVDHARHDATVKELGITAEVDRSQSGPDTRDERVDAYLKASDRGQYVNMAWAEKHGCSTEHRIEGTGVYCIVTGRQRIEAYLSGDPELFVTGIAAEYMLPADRQILFTQVGTEWRTHYAQRTPLSIATRDLASAAATWDTPANRIALEVELGSPIIDELLLRDAHELAVMIAGRLHAARLEQARVGGGDRVVIATDPADAEDLAYAFEIAKLPGHLRIH